MNNDMNDFETEDESIAYLEGLIVGRGGAIVEAIEKILEVMPYDDRERILVYLLERLDNDKV